MFVPGGSVAALDDVTRQAAATARDVSRLTSRNDELERLLRSESSRIDDLTARLEKIYSAKIDDVGAVIKEQHLDWGNASGQIRAARMPILDRLNYFLGLSTVEKALEFLGAQFVTVNGYTGLAVRVTAGEAISQGMCVSWSTTADDRIIRTPGNGDMPFGIAASTIANGASGFVVVSGYAWVLLKPGVAATRGGILFVSDTSGYADWAANIPSVALHNRELAHNCSSAAAGALVPGTLHFN